MLSFMNKPSTFMKLLLYRVQDHSHRWGNCHYGNFGVAKIAARFARLLPYLTTNPAAAYASIWFSSRLRYPAASQWRIQVLEKGGSNKNSPREARR